MNKLFLFLALTLLVLTTELKSADVPQKDAMGLGVVMNSYPFVSNNLGGVFSYNMSNDLQVGMKFGFSLLFEKVQGINGEETKTTTTTLFGPYVRYYFSNMKSLRPFVDAGLEIGTYQRVNGDYTYMRVNVGGEWNPYKSFGVIAGFNVFNNESNHKSMQLGIGAPFIGATWYF